MGKALLGGQSSILWAQQPPLPCPPTVPYPFPGTCLQLRHFPAQLCQDPAFKGLSKSTASILPPLFFFFFKVLPIYLDGKGMLNYPGSRPASGLAPHNSLFLLAINCRSLLSPIFQSKKYP